MVNFHLVWFDIECPKCGYSDSVQLIDVKTEKTIFCSNCKVLIQLKDEGASVHHGVETMQNAINKLQETLKKFGR